MHNGRKMIRGTFFFFITSILPRILNLHDCYSRLPIISFTLHSHTCLDSRALNHFKKQQISAIFFSLSPKKIARKLRVYSKDGQRSSFVQLRRVIGERSNFRILSSIPIRFHDPYPESITQRDRNLGQWAHTR